jgi:hypothetical protein
MDYRFQFFGPMMLNIANWCEKTGKIVLAADDPREMIIGYCTADDNDNRYWKIQVPDAKSCKFLKEKLENDRYRIVRFFHTSKGRKELRNHVNTCEVCLPASTHEE